VLIEEVKVGMKVRISTACRKTNDTVSVVPGMKKYLGSVQTVDCVDFDVVSIRGFSWHPQDLLTPDEDLLDRTPQFFDPENLIG